MRQPVVICHSGSGVDDGTGVSALPRTRPSSSIDLLSTFFVAYGVESLIFFGGVPL
jgi:hypothetical protein